ncbi:unnamed protein product, partial [Adineta ricciae]
MMAEANMKAFAISILILFSLTFVFYNIYSISSFQQENVEINDDYERGFISKSLYNQLYSYIQSRNSTFGQIGKRLMIENGTVFTLPTKNDYIDFLNKSQSIFYPYSTWKCSNTSNTDENAREYCLLTNIYYDSKLDRYYFYTNSSDSHHYRNTFQTPSDVIFLNRIDNLTSLRSSISSILTRSLLISDPPDLNYMHGFIEACAVRFWVLSECQSHSTFINPNQIQIYYQSTMFKIHDGNWKQYEQQSDGTYQPKRPWERILHSIFSVYPLLIHRSFNDTIVLFKYLLFPGRQTSRSVAWGYTHPYRHFPSYPLPTEHYRRAYLAYSEWILYHLNLKSKFQLTNVQNDLQKKNQEETIPFCLNQTCSNIQLENYTGEWIVVLNRYDTNIRRINNGKQLVKALLNVFPEHSNPYLRVWPKEFDFNDNFYESVHMSRSIRILIAVHGAGLANMIFMRPGTILFEINPYGCRHLPFYYRRWAEIFHLQHALWIPS